jgi:hypothetical protein
MEHGMFGRLANYKLDLVAVKEVRWDEGGCQPADSYTFFYGNGNSNHHVRTGFFLYQGISSAVKVKFVNDRMSYIILRITRACIRSIYEVLHEVSIRRFQ